ncbi:MAG: 3-deoxy-7-phosphoheptulonate synthase [bacterium]
MIIVLKPGVSRKEIKDISKRLKEKGYLVDVSEGKERVVIGAIGSNVEEKEAFMAQLSFLPCVEKVMPILKPYKLVSSEYREKTVVNVGDVKIGGRKVVLMAGPCAVEGGEQTLQIAKALMRAGVKILRAGAFKPRTSPYSFQGFGRKGLQMLDAARKATGIKVVTEVMEPRDVGMVAEHSDIVQIGTRNMHNFELLKEAGKSGAPVLLKRGFAATIEEWLLAAEYIAKEGNQNIILCERGIRTFETHTRNTLDLNAVAAVKQLSHLPVAVDPSHGTGRVELVAPLSRAAVAAGADGVMLEVHPDPASALSDGQQTISMKSFLSLRKELDAVAKAVGRTLG